MPRILYWQTTTLLCISKQNVYNLPPKFHYLYCRIKHWWFCLESASSGIFQHLHLTFRALVPLFRILLLQNFTSTQCELLIISERRKEVTLFTAILKLEYHLVIIFIKTWRVFPVHLGDFSIEKACRTLRTEIVHSVYCS